MQGLVRRRRNTTDMLVWSGDMWTIFYRLFRPCRFNDVNFADWILWRDNLLPVRNGWLTTILCLEKIFSCYKIANILTNGIWYHSDLEKSPGCATRWGKNKQTNKQTRNKLNHAWLWHIAQYLWSWHLVRAGGFTHRVVLCGGQKYFVYNSWWFS